MLYSNIGRAIVLLWVFRRFPHFFQENAGMLARLHQSCINPYHLKLMFVIFAMRKYVLWINYQRLKVNHKTFKKH